MRVPSRQTKVDAVDRGELLRMGREEIGDDRVGGKGGR
jgi:hypothetical protein